MRSSSPVVMTLLCALGCQGTATSHGGFERASTSDGSGLEKVNELDWKAALDAAHPVLHAGMQRYAVRKSSFSLIDDGGSSAATQKLKHHITSPLTVVSGVAYYGSDKSVVALAFPEGTVVWTANVGSPVTTSAAIVGGTVTVAADDLIALDAATGAEKWSYAGEGSFAGAPAVRGSNVFAATTDGFVYAINSETGQPVWEFETKSRFGAVPVSIIGDMAVVPDRGGSVWGLFADSGRERWRFPTRGVIGVGAAVKGDTAWVGNEAGDVSAINLLTGQELWRMTELPAVVTPPTWANGTIYVGCDDGKVVALDSEDGAHKWSFQLESEPLGAPVVGDGEMWMTDVAGRVYHVK